MRHRTAGKSIKRNAVNKEISPARRPAGQPRLPAIYDEEA
jgi:hypothetical protein